MTSLISVSLIWFTLFFIIGVKIKKIAIIDVAWASVFSVYIFTLCIANPPSLNHGAYLLIFLFWSLRLSFFLGITRIGKNKKDDPRYLEMANKWGKNYYLRRYLIYLFQALISLVIFSGTCFFTNNIIISNKTFYNLGLIIMLIGVIGETIADQQKYFFKKNSAAKVCNVGLWKYSRHPNYFFDIVFWTGTFIYSLFSISNIVYFYSPLIIILFLLFFSGIPLAEKNSVKNKGQAYIDYQNKTSILIPWKNKS